MRLPRAVAIDGLDEHGFGTGLDPLGHRWRLREGVPGSRVLAVGRPKSGHVREVVTLPADAVAPRCPQFGTCGGCTLQTLPLARQREEKLRALRVLLAPFGVDGAMIGTPDAYGYRDKLELTYGPRRWLSTAEAAAGLPRDGRFLGFHAPGLFDRIVDAPTCALGTPALAAVLARLRDDTLASPFPVHDPRTHAGFWRHVVLRGGDDGVAVVIYTAPAGPDEAQWLVAHAPGWGASVVHWYENDRPTDAAVGVRRAVLVGGETLTTRFGGVDFQLAPTAFFQANRPGAEILLAEVAAGLGERGTLLDLYGGVGALGLPLAARFDHTVGIELHEPATRAARDNAARLGLSATFLTGAVEALLPGVLADPALPRPLHVVVDPPRVGLHPDALRAVAALDAASLVYVACRPTSLRRDGDALLAAGWRCARWTAVDLFPHTPHVEVVATFVRDRPVGAATPDSS